LSMESVDGIRPLSIIRNRRWQTDHTSVSYTFWLWGFQWFSGFWQPNKQKNCYARTCVSDILLQGLAKTLKLLCKRVWSECASAKTQKTYALLGLFCLSASLQAHTSRKSSKSSQVVMHHLITVWLSW
jgi:hypothetical protein